jgi:hypothetical protein
MGVARINDRTFAPACRAIYAPISVRAASETILLAQGFQGKLMQWVVS